MVRAKRLLVILLLFIFVCGIINIGCSAEVKKQYQVYVNKKMGFSLEIPASWKGYYIIDETYKNVIEIRFIGKSKTVRNLDPDSKRNGLSMFYIGNENYVKDAEFIDSKQEIGISHKVKYYYFTNTDESIGVLEEIYNDSDFKDQQEKRLAHNDYLKAEQMRKDIKEILKSFKAR